MPEELYPTSYIAEEAVELGSFCTVFAKTEILRHARRGAPVAAIVRERESGTLEFLINTPVRRSELMIGKIIPYIVIGLVQVTIVLGLGVTLFRVPVRGSLVDLYLASALFIAATLSLGLLISTVAKSQFQSMQMIMFFFLPNILLSGFMFPFEGMPRAAQVFADSRPQDRPLLIGSVKTNIGHLEAAARVDDLLEQLLRGRVDPMDVLEEQYDGHRIPLCQRFKENAHRDKRAPLPGLGPGMAQQASDLG